MILVDPLKYEDWLKWREGGLGASDAATVMGVSPFERPEELWGRRTGRLGPKPDSFPMRRGRMLEPRARAEYERRTGIPMPKRLGMHDVFHYLRASFDGLNLELPRASEFKCPGQVDHGRACRGEVPAHYLWQCVVLMLVSNLPSVDYLSFDPGTDTREGTSALITVERDLALENAYIARAARFWSCIEDDRPLPDALTRPVRLSDDVRRRAARTTTASSSLPSFFPRRQR